MSDCWFCDGSGFWVSHRRKKTLFCPACRTQQAEHQALARTCLQSWYPSYWEQLEARYYGPRFQEEPWLLVLHSGATSDRIAEFFHETGRVKYGDRWVKVSAHINWSRNAGGFVQSVPLSHVAWHCGGSRFRGERKLNFCSIGIELPGPWDKERSDEELGKVREVVQQLCNVLPLTTVVRHSDIDSLKKDPGPGFRWDCLAGLGLEIG